MIGYYSKCPYIPTMCISTSASFRVSISQPKSVWTPACVLHLQLDEFSEELRKYEKIWKNLMVWDHTFSDQQSVSFLDPQFCIQSVSQNSSSPAQQLCKLSVFLSFSQYTSLPVQQLCRPSVYISNFQTGSFVYKQTLSICQWFSVYHFTSLAVLQTLSICQLFLDWQFCMQSDTQNLPVIFRLAVLYTVKHSVIFSSVMQTSDTVFL